MKDTLSYKLPTIVKTYVLYLEVACLLQPIVPSTHSLSINCNTIPLPKQAAQRAIQRRENMKRIEH